MAFEPMFYLNGPTDSMQPHGSIASATSALAHRTQYIGLPTVDSSQFSEFATQTQCLRGAFVAEQQHARLLINSREQQLAWQKRLLWSPAQAATRTAPRPTTRLPTTTSHMATSSSTVAGLEGSRRVASSSTCAGWSGGPWWYPTMWPTDSWCKQAGVAMCFGALCSSLVAPHYCWVFSCPKPGL